MHPFSSDCSLPKTAPTPLATKWLQGAQSIRDQLQDLTRGGRKAVDAYVVCTAPDTDSYAGPLIAFLEAGQPTIQTKVLCLWTLQVSSPEMPLDVVTKQYFEEPTEGALPAIILVGPADMPPSTMTVCLTRALSLVKPYFVAIAGPEPEVDLLSSVCAQFPPEIAEQFMFIALPAKSPPDGEPPLKSTSPVPTVVSERRAKRN